MSPSARNHHTGHAVEEIADRTWVVRHPWLDVTMTAVAGERGLVLLDSLGSERALRSVLESLPAARRWPVVAVVNTHHHFDHTFGNAAAREHAGEPIPIHAQEEAAALTEAEGRRVQQEHAQAPDDPHREAVLATRVVAADHVFSSVTVLDLGDRCLELVHPGRGHTAGDVVVAVPDVHVLVAGDLIEESGPPAYGPDCYPLEWPTSLDIVVDLVDDRTQVVPGHGAVVDASFVRDQRADVAMVAQNILDLAGESVPLATALTEGLNDRVWPWPSEALEHAVRRGYAQLPPAARRLPLV